MESLLNKTNSELKAFLKKLGWPEYKARILFRGLHQQYYTALDNFSGLSKEERTQLAALAFIDQPEVAVERSSPYVKKTAFRFSDGAVAEAVLMRHHDRATVCLSSQSGCPIGCRFCATGSSGFRRNLTTGEILSQLYYFARQRKISNVVFMGMGEPFLNYQNVLRSAKLINSYHGINIAARKLVISTVGIIPGIRRLATEPEQFRLAWSLVSTQDELRRELIRYKGLASIASTVAALAEYQKKTGRRITIEYLLLGGVNDTPKEWRQIGKICQDLDCHVNIIPFNPLPGSRFRPGDNEGALSFLSKLGVNATIRESLGIEINAACGQLAGALKTNLTPLPLKD